MRTTASPPTVQKTGTAIKCVKIGSTFVLKQVYITLFDSKKKENKKKQIKKEEY